MVSEAAARRDRCGRWTAEELERLTPAEQDAIFDAKHRY